MNTIQKKRCLKLADFLENRVKRENFDLSAVVRTKHRTKIKDVIKELKKGPAKKCGAAACAIGWTPEIFPTHFKWEVSEDSFYPEEAECEVIYKPHNDHAFCSEVGKEFFGLEAHEFEKIFNPSENYNTAKQVANRLRLVVKKYEIMEEGLLDDEEVV